MRFLITKRIFYGVVGLLVVLIILGVAGWFLPGPRSDASKQQLIASAPPGSSIDAGCAAVYQRIMSNGMRGMYIEAMTNFKVEKALYISGKEAKARYNPSIYIDDNSYICYVLLSGNIEVSRQDTRTVQIYPTAIAYYDPDSLAQMYVTSSPN